MSVLSILAAFGGGAFGASLGALPAFIMTGVIAIIGTAIGLGSGVDVITGNVAFGPLFGPHVAFAGGVAAAAYAARKNNTLAGGNLGGGDVAVATPQGITNGADILYSLNGTGDASVILVGGLFGVIGFLINYLYANILVLPTDTVAMTVATSGLIVRFAIGKTGLTGKYEGNTSREYLPKGNSLIYIIVLGLVVGIAVCYTGALLESFGVSNEVLQGSFPGFVFAISAVSLIFAQIGFTSPTTHHISITAAYAFVYSGNPIIGVVVAIIAAILGEFFVKTVNSYCDSHIDPPACTIFLLSFIIFIVFK